MQGEVVGLGYVDGARPSRATRVVIGGEKEVSSVGFGFCLGKPDGRYALNWDGKPSLCDWRCCNNTPDEKTGTRKN